MHDKEPTIMLERALPELVLKAYTSYTICTNTQASLTLHCNSHSSLADKCNCLDDDPT